MEFTFEQNKFTVPDRPTVRQQLKWFGVAQGYEKSDTWIRNWEGAKQLIQTWESDVLPDYKVDIDTLTNPSQREVIIWAGAQVLMYMNSLEDIPKNS